MQQNEKKKLLKKALQLLVFFVLILLVRTIINLLFDNLLTQSLKSNQHAAFWSHRGIINEKVAENSISAFEIAINNGVTGIETDVFWVDSIKKCVVMHDFDSNFIKRSYLTLDSVLYRFKDSISYWIDFKNLNSNNVDVIKKYLNDLILKNPIKNKVYIESGNGLALRKLDSENIKTLYWIQYNRSNFIIKELKLFYTKLLILNSNFDGYSIAFSYMDSDFKNHFTGLPIYLFHGNFKQYKTELLHNQYIKVCLVDQDFY